MRWPYRSIVTVIEEVLAGAGAGDHRDLAERLRGPAGALSEDLAVLLGRGR